MHHLQNTPQLFPSLDFLLVDPAPFTIRPTPRIKIRRDFFTEELCHELRGSELDLLFICDVRSCDWKIATAEEVQVRVMADMKDQVRYTNCKRIAVLFLLRFYFLSE
jgi:hypothetical protein